MDIVSNIVGILIILVMIAGIRAQQSPPVRPEQENEVARSDEEPREETTPETIVETAVPPKIGPEPSAPRVKYADRARYREIETQFESVRDKEKKVVELQSAMNDVLLKSEAVAGQVELRNKERVELLRLLGIARAELEILAGEKDQSAKERIELQRQIREIEVKLEQLDQTKNWFQANRPKATVLENIPTPISKTVEDKEVHFRLLGGRIVYVPLTELFEKLNLEIAANKNRYFKQKTSTGVIGPIDRFRLEFMLSTYDVMMRDAYGSGVGSRLELEYAEFVPIHEPLGQPLGEALAAPNSDLKNRLRLYRQDVYTITLWVYPDSFEEFQQLKQFLYSQGYKVAARPLQNGAPISGSHRGSKSSSQ